jgi:hypothetical protein
MDRRKENGGHSTKAKGVDKRKNEWKNAVEESVSYDDVKSLLTKAVQIGLSDKPDRLKAMQMVFDYTLGKPKESIDLNGQLGASFDFKEIVSAIRGDK